MLGRDVAAVLSAEPGTRITAAARTQLDITDADAVLAAVAMHDVIVNAAAWTNVDGAEADEASAAAVNAKGVENLAAACAKSGSVLVHISTDYVFSGEAVTAYPEDAPLAPANAYGRTKAAGEVAVHALAPENGYVVRTAWLYGEHGRNFVATILAAAARGEPLKVVNDAVGQPTWSRALARQLVALGQAAVTGKAPPGVYHGTAAGRTTWYGLARAVLELSGLDPGLVSPVGSDAFPRPARRPAFSVLDHKCWARTPIAPLPHWHSMLAEAFMNQAFARFGSGMS
jgi:dTDP-4-dehydrorhamnose reductase